MVRFDRLWSYLPITENNIFYGRQCFQPHRAACMQFLRADADLGTEAEFKAIRETGGGIDINGSRVDLVKKTQCVAVIFRDDCFGVAGVVAVDMSDGFIEGSYCPDREYVIKILFAPVLFRSGGDMICSTAKCVERGWITAQLDPVLIQFFLQCSKQRFFDFFVYDNRLTGIADTNTLTAMSRSALSST